MEKVALIGSGYTCGVESVCAQLARHRQALRTLLTTSPYMQVIEAFAEHKKLPKEMRRRIHSYFDYVTSNRKDQAADQALIESLSPQLQIDVRLYIYEDMLTKVRPHQ